RTVGPSRHHAYRARRAATSRLAGGGLRISDLVLAPLALGARRGRQARPPARDTGGNRCQLEPGPRLSLLRPHRRVSGSEAKGTRSAPFPDAAAHSRSGLADARRRLGRRLAGVFLSGSRGILSPSPSQRSLT